MTDIPRHLHTFSFGLGYHSKLTDRGLEEALAHKAQTQLQATMEAAGDRLDTARLARQLLDIGGDATVQALLAKKGSIDASVCNADVVQSSHSVAAAYIASSAALVQAATTRHDDSAVLAEAHAARARIYQDVVVALVDLVPAPTLSGPERDACSILQAKTTGHYVAARVVDGAQVGGQIVASTAVGGAEMVKAWMVSGEDVSGAQRFSTTNIKTSL